ncbi:MAG: hypothetical protein ACPLZ9_04565, partial [Candidatus Ratteibacteria bacterium]
LFFSIGNDSYYIKKHISKSGKTTTYLYKNNVEIAEGKQVHSLIENSLIGMDFTSFRNSVFIAQNEAMSLIDLSGSERRNVLRKLLKLRIYDILIDVANQTKSEYENKKANLEGEINTIKSLISNKDEIESEIKKAESELNLLLKEKQNSKSKISKLENDISNLSNKIQKNNELYDEIKVQLETIKSENKKLKDEIYDLNEKLSKIKGVSVCPYCLSKIENPEHLRKHYESEISTRKEKISKNESKIKTMEDEAKEYEKIIEDLNSSLNEKITEKNNEELKMNEKIAILKTKIDERKKTLEQIEEMKKQMVNKENELNIISKKIEAVDFLKEVYKEVPNIIIRRIIPYIESEAGEIVNFISDGFIEDIVIDKETFKIKPVVNGVEEELQFLSGGEKLRVGIALRLAISKLVVSETQSGTIKNLFIDEGDFGALDENGLNDIAMLFEKLKNNFNKIILITHIKELKDRIADYAYNVIKNGNYSSKVEVFNE